MYLDWIRVVNCFKNAEIAPDLDSSQWKKYAASLLLKSYLGLGLCVLKSLGLHVWI